MGGLADLIRVVLERSMFAAFFVGVFCGIIMIGAHFGLSVPPVVMTWLFVALAACVSLVLCQGSIMAYSRVSGVRKSEVQAKARKERREDEAARNLSSLYREEIEMLVPLLEDGAPRRFEVGMYSGAESLVHKGVFVPVRRGSHGSTICEVEETIYENRVEIREEYKAALAKSLQ